MKLSEIRDLVHISRPAAPYGDRRLARCYSIGDLARLARRRLPEAALGYLEGGGEDEYTLRRNRDAFDSLELVPRVLNDVSRVDTSTLIMGVPVPLPIALAPVGAPRLIHHEGELAVARAASRARLPYGISTLATFPLEEIAHESDGILWFQLYVWGDRGVAKELIEKAKGLGYQALLVSVDVTVRSKRERELRAGLTLPTPHLTIPTVLEGATHPYWWWHFLTSEPPSFPNVSRPGLEPGRQETLSQMFDGTVSWDDLDWIMSAWDGPIALKGVLSADDARHAADLGVDAVIVSNHGGRQLDHVPPAIDVLPRIVDEVGDRVEVLLDSGIRRGTDIVAALALGASGVLIGRAYLYGLGAAGEAGVRHAIDILREEIRTAMALCGAAKLTDLNRRLIHKRSGTSAGPAVREPEG